MSPWQTQPPAQRKAQLGRARARRARTSSRSSAQVRPQSCFTALACAQKGTGRASARLCRECRRGTMPLRFMHRPCAIADPLDCRRPRTLLGGRLRCLSALRKASHTLASTTPGNPSADAAMTSVRCHRHHMWRVRQALDDRWPTLASHRRWQQQQQQQQQRENRIKCALADQLIWQEQLSLQGATGAVAVRREGRT